jgi:hypothetical protein
MPYVKINGPGSHILVQCESEFTSFEERLLGVMVCCGPEGGD